MVKIVGLNAFWTSRSIENFQPIFFRIKKNRTKLQNSFEIDPVVLFSFLKVQYGTNCNFLSKKTSETFFGIWTKLVRIFLDQLILDKTPFIFTWDL